MVPTDEGCPGPSGEGRCGRPIKADGLCISHYRQRAAGKRLKPLRGRASVSESTRPLKYGVSWTEPRNIERIERLAELERTSVAELIRERIESWLASAAVQKKLGEET